MDQPTNLGNPALSITRVHLVDDTRLQLFDAVESHQPALWRLGSSPPPT